MIMKITESSAWSSLLKITVPAIIIGLIILPNIALVILKGHVAPSKPKPIKQPKYEAIPVFSEVIEVPEQTPVKVKLPPEKSKELGLLAMEIKFPQRAKVIINVSKIVTPFIPSEEYDILSEFEIVFKDAETGKILEPSGFIYFHIPKDFLKAKGYDPKKVVMLKFHEVWTKLKTEMLGEDNVSYYYVAETESFSVFAIAVVRIASENCTECHQDVATELSMSPYHNFNCTFCHPGMSRNVTCVQCHFDIGNFSAHKKFIEWAENNTLMVGSNEACIGCHTSANIPIYNITERTYISFSSDIRKLHEH